MSKEILGGRVISRPSLFDIGLYIFISLCPIFFLKPWHIDMIQSIFFIFGVFALLGLSFLCERQVIYRNKYLGFIILWSLLNVFIHTFNSSYKSSYASIFINYCFLSEGFIYVLCGSLLFYLIVSYVRNFKIFYPILVINILNLFFVIIQLMKINLVWFVPPVPCGMMATVYQLKVFSAFSIPILWQKNRWLAIIPISNLLLTFKSFLGQSFAGIIAVILGLVIYLVITKRIKSYISWIIVILGFLFLYQSAWSKILNRLYLWGIAVKQMLPNLIFGRGFDNSITGNTILTKNGWALMHNDYLNITRDQGLPFLIFIGMIVYGVLKKAKVDYLWLAIIILAISCFIQTSFYYPRIAIFGIAMLALKAKEKCLNINL